MFRHGDRTPKQKMKMTINNKEFLRFFHSNCKEVKIKNAKDLEKIKGVTETMLDRILESEDVDENRIQDEIEKIAKLL
jgi:hypothetical protein